MIRYQSQKQQTLPGFETPFQTALDENNRWVKLSECIPWDDLAEGYYQGFSVSQGRSAKDARLMIGAVIIKHKLCLSDEETVMQIQENPYLQYFVGFMDYQTQVPFSPTLFVEIRKRMGQAVFDIFQSAIITSLATEKARQVAQRKQLEQALEQASTPPSVEPHSEKTPVKAEPVCQPESELATETPAQAGKLIIDATVADQAIRNLGHIEQLLTHYPEGTQLPLPHWLLRRYWVIQYVFAQQWVMYQNKTQRCDNRIVSISQPYVRPIVRGKLNKAVEFGAKLSVSLNQEGIARVDQLRWHAFNEGGDLIAQVEAYRQRYGHYPEAVLADTIYGTHANRRYLKQKNIRFAGKPLGRPRKVTDANREALKQQQAQRREEYRQRIPIEGKFGQGKGGYRLNYIRAKRADTSLAWINSIFLVMNLLVLYRLFIGCWKRGATSALIILWSIFVRVLQVPTVAIIL